MLQPYFLAKSRSFSSLFNKQSKSITVTFGHLSANYQGYSLTFQPNIAHFHHFSICNQNQSLSPLVISRQNTKVIAVLFGQQSFIFITFQSAIKINHCHFWSFLGKIQRLQPYYLAKHRSFSSLFNLQSKSITVTFGHLSAKIPKLLPYYLAKHRSFSSLFNLQSKSINFNFWSVYGKLPRLQPYFLAKHRSFSSLFNLQS